MADGFTEKEVFAPCCGEDVVVKIQIPTHHPRVYGMQTVVSCPSCGDVFKTIAMIVTKTEKIVPAKPKLELIDGGKAEPPILF